MKSYIFCLLLMAIYCEGYTQTKTYEWLSILNKTIAQSDEYDGEKLFKIYELSQTAEPANKHDLFARYLELYDAYSIFNYDSAYVYAKKLEVISQHLNDSSLLVYAKLKLNFILLSSGMFKEVIDSLKTIETRFLNNARKAEYYTLMARCYYDLADYDHDMFYSPLYNREANRYIDSSLELLPRDSFEYIYYNGLKNIRAGNDQRAFEYLETLMDKPNLTTHELAITASTLSDIYIRRGNTDSAIYLLIRAAIADIQTSTKETSAIFNLATLLFKKGDVKNASLFIQKATNDAQRYGARHRMVQLSSILPLIEGKKLVSVENEKRNIFSYALILTFVVLLLMVLTAIIIMQVRKLKIQQKEINHKNISLEHMVEEKEWLRKEIHHRVKNNLHTINSLLESQSAYLENEALSAIRDSQHRVYAMVLVHQKLYQSEKNLMRVDISVYLHELVNYLRESFDTGSRIRFQLGLEHIDLDISVAVPLGLILNEAITNSFKYAFPGTREGVVYIAITRSADNHFIFTVADNGIGLPAGFDLTKSSSLGMSLMKGLSEDIKATFTIARDAGTKIIIKFKTDKEVSGSQQGRIPGKREVLI